MVRRDAAANREALLDAARALLNQDPTTSLEQIAAFAGLSRRSVYGHFPTRDALLDALAARGTERVVTAVAEVAHADPVVRLALIAAAVWDDVAGVRVMTLQTLSSERASIVDSALEPLRTRILEAVEEGAAAGSVRSDMPPRIVARFIEDAVIGVFPLTIREGMTAHDGRVFVVRSALSAAGLGWRETEALLAAHPELTAERKAVDPLWPATATLRIAGSAAPAESAVRS